MTPRLFHHKNLIRLRHWPRALLATSTHDTKRSEDVRARINVLSEIPIKWYEAVRHWSQLNRNRKTDVDGVEIPDRNAEYLLYQTLVGLWPFDRLEGSAHTEFVRRIQDYMDKALKEAKVHTSWINPNHRHDCAVRDFVAGILEPGNGNTFFGEFGAFVVPVAKAGLFNALSQLTLKIASPGTPDFYQGSEMWDFSLVDPDNRRPVDFARRRAALDGILKAASNSRSELVSELLRTAEDGRIKLYVTGRALTYRRANTALFESGSYHPIEAVGGRNQHVIAFARKLGKKVVIAAAGRFFLKLNFRGHAPVGRDVWGETALALPKILRASEFEDVFTGCVIPAERKGDIWTLPLGGVFGQLPLALLEAR